MEMKFCEITLNNWEIKAFMEATKENEWLKRVEISLVEIYDENELIDLWNGWVIGIKYDE